MIGEPIFALTSLSAAKDAAALTRTCIQSWRKAGLHVCAFNHPSEISALSSLYDTDFVPIEETTQQIFGKHFVPITAMLRWAQKQDCPVLIINSDILLRLEEWEVKRARWLSDGGLCYFIRYNHDGDTTRAHREVHGIDAFLFHGRDAGMFPASFLSMGQPFWDYWLPHTFAQGSRPLYTVEFPAAFHRNHGIRWSWDNWHRCAVEFGRLTGRLEHDQSIQACMGMCQRVRQSFDGRKVTVTRQPMPIRNWVQQIFQFRGPKTFLELGAHLGTDTNWMARIPGVRIYAFEPDPRNQQPPLTNVTPIRAAVADRDGTGALILSEHGWGQVWTHSSSLKRPKNHLQRFPVSFGASVEVELVALDTFCEQRGLGEIDFIWADVQGAEEEMIRGGCRTLSRTRYLYTAFSDEEMYEGQPTLRQILKMLPDFRVRELWPDNVLLENRSLRR